MFNANYGESQARFVVIDRDGIESFHENRASAIRCATSDVVHTGYARITERDQDGHAVDITEFDNVNSVRCPCGSRMAIVGHECWM